QARYATTFVARAKGGHLSWRDRLRLSTPVLAALVPLYSLLVKGGLLCGRVGVLYALDRCIAELIMYRQALASRARRAHQALAVKGPEGLPGSAPEVTR